MIIGESDSGGAIAIAAGNHVLMMEHAIYSVISPEGCASILYRDAAKAIRAAGKAIDKALHALLQLSEHDLKTQRRERFYTIGREGLN